VIGNNLFHRDKDEIFAHLESLNKKDSIKMKKVII